VIVEAILASKNKQDLAFAYSSVADPGYGALLTPGSGMDKKIKIRIRDPGWVKIKIRTRDPDPV
jgi:hypothetical protein